MSLQRQFEGPDVRVLLEEIRTTYGDDPVISRAETFRSGGVFGLFQREQYRLVVDAPDELERDPYDLAGRARTSKASTKRRKAGKHFASAPVAASKKQSSRRAPGRTAPVATSPSRAAVTTSTAAAVAPSAPAVRAKPAPTTDLRSYVGGSRSAAGANAPAVRRPARVPSSPADIFAAMADLTEDSDLVSVAPSTKSPEVRGPGGQSSFEKVLSGVARMTGAPEHFATAQGESMPTSPAAGSDRESSGTAGIDAEEPELLGSELFLPTDLPTDDLVELNNMSQLSQAGCPADPEVATRQSALRQELTRLGLEAESATRVEAMLAGGSSTMAALSALFETIPAAPRIPKRPGSLVVVVGAGQRALNEAARLVAQEGWDPSTVGVASPRSGELPVREELYMRDAADATEVGPSLRRGRVGVVAVDSPNGSDSTVWARHLISALRPTMVIGVVDAMHKSEDVARWVEAIDGVDAIVVDRIEATTSPASILSLGIPVMRLGEHPSTPARWVAALVDLLSEESRSFGEPVRARVIRMDDVRDCAERDETSSQPSDLAANGRGLLTTASAATVSRIRPVDWAQVASKAAEGNGNQSALR
ncbi:MAG: hypothetical protein ACP5P1_10340 [Acidimicrobiales bacterium]